MKRERWRAIYGGLYEVSDLGRIRRLAPSRGTRVGKIKRPIVSPIWYPVANLSVGGKQILQAVHRIVADAFLGPRPKGKEVNHKNGDKTDCRLSNLEYVTSSQNKEHAYRSGLHRKKLSPDMVKLIRAERALGVAASALADKYEVNVSTIRRVITGARWSHV